MVNLASSPRAHTVTPTQEGVMTRRKLAALFVPLAVFAAVAVVLAATATAAPKPIVIFFGSPPESATV